MFRKCCGDDVRAVVIAVDPTKVDIWVSLSDRTECVTKGEADCDNELVACGCESLEVWLAVLIARSFELLNRDAQVGLGVVRPLACHIVEGTVTTAARIECETEEWACLFGGLFGCFFFSGGLFSGFLFGGWLVSDGIVASARSTGESKHRGHCSNRNAL